MKQHDPEQLCLKEQQNSFYDLHQPVPGAPAGHPGRGSQTKRPRRFLRYGRGPVVGYGRRGDEEPHLVELIQRWVPGLRSGGAWAAIPPSLVAAVEGVLLRLAPACLRLLGGGLQRRGLHGLVPFLCEQ